MPLDLLRFELLCHVPLLLLQIGGVLELKGLVDDIVLGEEHEPEDLNLVLQQLGA